MIKNKKMLMTLSFCLGAVMLAATAFADITTKTGYDQFKDSLKFTAENIIEKAQSYTAETTASVSDNGNLLMSVTNKQKVNHATKQTENASTAENNTGKLQDSYYYNDENVAISHNIGNDLYYVTEYSHQINSFQPGNPFKEERAKDAEKIADALVGNLKDYIIINDKADGSKELSGSLSEAQIPALVNAVASFGVKQTFSENRMGNGQFSLPQITDDIFIKSAKANINVNKDGIIESVLASATLSGKDKAGIVHDITIDLLMRLSDINSTTITKPDLTGKKIEKSVQKDQDNKIISQSFIGKYKNDIIILKDDKFTKIGERNLEITEIKDNHIIGKYSEEYKTEYASEYTIPDLTFDAEMKDPYYAPFTATLSDGNKTNGSINWNMNSGSINFYFDHVQNRSFDGNFSRVFD